MSLKYDNSMSSVSGKLVHDMMIQTRDSSYKNNRKGTQVTIKRKKQQNYGFCQSLLFTIRFVYGAHKHKCLMK